MLHLAGEVSTSRRIAQRRNLLLAAPARFSEHGRLVDAEQWVQTVIAIYLVLVIGAGVALNILRHDGAKPPQGALAWIWARSQRTIPIPGFKSRKQVLENARAMEYGPLTQSEMEEIEGILRRTG